jgi:hypothetical protein
MAMALLLLRVARRSVRLIPQKRTGVHERRTLLLLNTSNATALHQLQPHQPHHCRGLSNKSRVKPMVAPIVDLERRLKQRHQSRDKVLQIYQQEKDHFANSNCWVAAVEHLFRGGGQQQQQQQRGGIGVMLPMMRIQMERPASSPSSPPPPQPDSSSSSSAVDSSLFHRDMSERTQSMTAFLNDLADTIDQKGIGFFGRYPTAKIARLLSTDRVSSSSPYAPAVQRFVRAAGQNISFFAFNKGSCSPLEATDVVMACARLGLHDVFDQAIDYLQNDIDRLRWLLTAETTPLLVWSCAKMRNRAPRLFHLVSQRPERAVGIHQHLRAIIMTLQAHISLGHCHHTTLFDRVIKYHSYFVNQGTIGELADLADMLSYAEHTDSTLFFTALDQQRATDVATYGTPTDLAKLLKAASIVVGPTHRLPALMSAIDAQADRIVRQCVRHHLPAMMMMMNNNDNNNNNDDNNNTNEPVQKKEVLPSQQQMNDMIHQVLASLPVRPTASQVRELEEEQEQVMPRKKKNKKNKQTNHQVDLTNDASSSSSVTTLATIVYAYSLLQHPCPELYRVIEQQDDQDAGYAESICAAATTVHDLHRIATALESLGYAVPHFRHAIGQWQQQQDKNAAAAAVEAALQQQQDQPKPAQEISNGQ